MTKTQESTSKDEQIGFHKGSLSTLAKEREELTRIIAITEQLMQMHIKALKELGVDLVAEAQKTQQGHHHHQNDGASAHKKSSKGDSNKIEDLV